MKKTERLLVELNSTVTDLQHEENGLKNQHKDHEMIYHRLDKAIRETIAPKVDDYRHSYTELCDKRAGFQKPINLFSRQERQESRKVALQSDSPVKEENSAVQIGIPDAVVQSLSLKISAVLKAWHFPGK